ncbi:RNase J family beta-CASP ribonuclease [Candidatus Woesearchaeota archaeon]|nr:RNase J family beta-CASP ribonuclease [Candidatus Woesearchaeota archaeon]
MIEIRTVGGYDEVGKNMTAVRVGDEVVLFDMGLHIDNYIAYTEDEDIINISKDELIGAGAVPDITALGDWKGLVTAIVITHAHLDHLGAVPFIAGDFPEAMVYCTAYTAAVLETILADEKLRIPNAIKTLTTNSSIWLSETLKLEFINATHSVPQTVMAALHTPDGILLYANDYKFDNTPVLGKKPNYDRLKEIGSQGRCLALFIDSTYAAEARKTPSEAVAKQLLADVMLGTVSKGKAMIVTTFSSHLARLKSILEFGRSLDRKVVFCGRSLAKYITAGERIGIIDFSSEAEIVGFGLKVRKRLKRIEREGKHRYLIVCTGHQGEPQAVLAKIAKGVFDFQLGHEDHVIFSCTVIPTALNRRNRAELESQLRSRHVRIFSDIHVSGHAAREDHRDLINMVKPTHIIPAHGEPRMLAAMKDLALEMGYTEEKVHTLSDCASITIEDGKMQRVVGRKSKQ